MIHDGHTGHHRLDSAAQVFMHCATAMRVLVLGARTLNCTAHAGNLCSAALLLRSSCTYSVHRINTVLVFLFIVTQSHNSF